jgi:hypothetical protein
MSGSIPRCVVAHLGRFLPRLGPFVLERPLLYVRNGPSAASAWQSHATIALLQCNMIPLAFCAPHIYIERARPTIMSLVSLPSLGVSSLDLGRTDLRAAPFISKAGVGRPPRKADGRSKVGERGMAQARLRIATQHNRAASRSSLRCRPPLQQQRQRGEHLGGHVSERTRQLLEILAL